MKILLVNPTPRESPRGNSRTAARWASMLRALGHRVTIAGEYAREACDVMIALHARKSSASVRRWRRNGGTPLVLALTGTDLYPDVYRSHAASLALDAADRLIVLQPLGRSKLKPRHRAKTRVVYQCALPNKPRAPRRRRGSFDVCVVGHLRPVKDPFRTAMAVRALPSSSRVRVLHAGKALSEGMARRAASETKRNPRYRWLGLLSAARTRTLLARCDLLVLSSKHEGGANIISEAVASDLPLLASRIDGNIGLLGGRYPGYFPAGDTRALTRLLERAETDPEFLARLTTCCRELVPLLADPEREKDALAGILAEVVS